MEVRPRLKFSMLGMVGVVGTEPVEPGGDARLTARLMGRKMPAPGIEVEKYRTLPVSISHQL